MFINLDTEFRSLTLDEIDFVSGGTEGDKAREDRTKYYVTGEKPGIAVKPSLQERVRQEDEKRSFFPPETQFFERLGYAADNPATTLGYMIDQTLNTLSAAGDRWNPINSPVIGPNSKHFH